MRRRLLVATIAALLLGGGAVALALPQQQGSVDLLDQANGQWQGPGAGQGSSATGSSVVGLGDIFGDGDPGLAIGAPYAGPHGRSEAGVVYVVDLAKLHADIDLSQTPLDPAVVGVIDGPAACAESGYALADAGRIGGGGADDLLVGAPGAGGCPTTSQTGVQGGNAGAAFLVYGDGLPGTLDLAAGGNQVSEFDGAASGDRTGAAVSGGGSSGSFLIGAPYASPGGRNGAGAVYQLRGATPGQTVSLASQPAGSTEFDGAAADDALGFALSTTADFASGDPAGTVELALGAPQASPDGRTHAGSVFLVPAAGEPATVDLSQLGTSGGLAGGRIDGADPGDEAGYAVAGVGDLNGDGTPDLAIGAPFMNSQTGQGRYDNGAAYVVYGASGPLNLDLAALGSRGYIAFGARDSDEAGTAVAGIADESGDGRPDLLIGAPYAENTSSSTPTAGGAVYAVFGFGTPAVSYSPGGETVPAGEPLSPLTPSVRATGQPRFSISPGLPDGVVLDPNTGEISGTPTTPTPSTVYTVQMTDLAGVADATVTLEVTGGGGGSSGNASSGKTPGVVNGLRAHCSSHAPPTARVLHVAGGRHGLRVTGTASASQCARVIRVQLAVTRLAARRCRLYLGGRRFSAPQSCATTLWLRATGTSRWSYRLAGPLPAGAYRISARAIDSSAAVQQAVRAVTVRLS